LFRAFELVQPEAVRVVILGQDPYHGPHQANGLAFAVDPDQVPPPSLRNIQKALENDRLACRSEGLESLMNGPVDWGTGDLEAWAGQGVLLMNDVLTVEDGCPGAHRSWGWSLWTEYVIHTLQSSRQGLVWMLWGKEAQRHHAGQLAQEGSVHHRVLAAPHPSPLSAYRGFLNCRHFSKANRFLSSYL
jgi:uracil-DNA glycosylase